MERVYSEAGHMRKERELRKCKRSIRRVWRMNKCRSKKARKDRDGRGSKIQKRRITGEIYGKVAVWIGQWEVWGRIPKKVGKKLAKIKVSFSKGKTLKGG